MNGKVCIIRRYLCHDIKKPMSYHIMKLYVMTCCMSRLSWHPYNVHYAVYASSVKHGIKARHSIRYNIKRIESMVNADMFGLWFTHCWLVAR